MAVLHSVTMKSCLKTLSGWHSGAMWCICMIFFDWGYGVGGSYVYRSMNSRFFLSVSTSSGSGKMHPRGHQLEHLPCRTGLAGLDGFHQVSLEILT